MYYTVCDVLIPYSITIIPYTMLYVLHCIPYSITMHTVADRTTDRQTDIQTYRHTDRTNDS